MIVRTEQMLDEMCATLGGRAAEHGGSGRDREHVFRRYCESVAKEVPLAPSRHQSDHRLWCSVHIPVRPNDTSARPEDENLRVMRLFSACVRERHYI